jgi:hypothetical protein
MFIGRRTPEGVNLTETSNKNKKFKKLNPVNHLFLGGLTGSMISDTLDFSRENCSWRFTKATETNSKDTLRN